MRRVAAGLALVITLLAPPAAVVDAAEVPVTDGAVQVTGDVNPFRAYASPVVAVDPRDERAIVVAYGEARSSGCGVHFSTNGGLSWTAGASPLPKEVAACVRNTNGPVADLAFAPDGTLYYALAGYPQPNDFHSRIYVARSTDLGRTFSTTAIPGLEPPYPEDMFADACSTDHRCRSDQLQAAVRGIPGKLRPLLPCRVRLSARQVLLQLPPTRLRRTLR
jgi:hypothetical protein